VGRARIVDQTGKAGQHEIGLLKPSQGAPRVLTKEHGRSWTRIIQRKKQVGSFVAKSNLDRVSQTSCPGLVLNFISIQPGSSVGNAFAGLFFFFVIQKNKALNKPNLLLFP